MCCRAGQGYRPFISACVMMSEFYNVDMFVYPCRFIVVNLFTEICHCSHDIFGKLCTVNIMYAMLLVIEFCGF